MGYSPHLNRQCIFVLTIRLSQNHGLGKANCPSELERVPDVLWNCTGSQLTTRTKEPHRSTPLIILAFRPWEARCFSRTPTRTNQTRIMKRFVLTSLCLFSATQASLSATVELVPAAEVSFARTDHGPHDNAWTKTVQEKPPDGTVAERTHSYTELATGANYWDGNGWVPSTSEIEIINGNAVARHGQIQIIWSPNSNVAGAVDAQSMDGKRFQSHVLGIAYTSRQSGASFFVANPQDCIGEVAGNTVIYRNAFDSIPADIVYVYGPVGLEQNIVLKQALPNPAQAPWNLDPSTVSVEIYTEFIDPPEVTVTTTILQSESDPGKRQFM